MIIKFFGQYLIRQKIVTIPQLVAALEYQETRNRMIGTYGVDAGQISEADVETVLNLQHNKDVLFGQGALELGLLSESQLKGLILAQQEDHVQLGNALTALGYVDKETMKRALDDFTEKHGSDVELESEIPPEIRDRRIISRFFDMTRKMLLRKWGVRNKPIEIRTAAESVLLSDYNVEVAIDGQWTGRYLLAAPIEVMSRAALRTLGTEQVTDDDRDELMIEFANAICGNMLDLFSEEAKKISIEPPVCIPQKYHLSDGMAVILCFLTSDGLVFTGVVLEG
jgi:CheY-specific phosphatase CheX